MTIYDVIRKLISGGFASEEEKAEALAVVDSEEAQDDSEEAARALQALRSARAWPEPTEEPEPT